MTSDLLATLVRPPWGWIMAAVWGAIWGSFCNVAIYRMALLAVDEEKALQAAPERSWLAGEIEHWRWLGRGLRSLVRPSRSFCPACRAPIRGIDNLPLASWLFLGGRCRACRAPISVRYPAIELISILLALSVYYRFVVVEPVGPLAELARFFVYFAFAAVLLVLTVIDLDTMLLPDSITLPAIVVFFLASRLLGQVPTASALLGLALGYGGLELLAFLWRMGMGREAMGGGDAKLLGMIGVLLGWRALPWTLLGGALLGTAVALPVLAVGRKRRRTTTAAEPPILRVEVPFGPFLAAAALAYLFFGDALHAWLAGVVLS